MRIWTQDASLFPVESVTEEPDWPRPAPGPLGNLIVWNLVYLGYMAKFWHRGDYLAVLSHVAHLARTVVIVEAVGFGVHDDLTDTPSTSAIAGHDQSVFAGLVDMNRSLVDHVARLGYQLCSALPEGSCLRMSCERMVAGSVGVLCTTPAISRG